MPGQSTKYRHVPVVAELLDEIEALIEDRRAGHRSVSEFVHEAIRLHLQDLRRRGP